MLINPERAEPLSNRELYLFDTTGILRIPGFLSREAVDLCRAEALQLPSRVMTGRGDKQRFDDLAARSLHLGELARSAGMRGCVEPLINQPYRLIESYALRRERDSVFYLHNGNSEILEYGSGRAAQRNMSFSHTFHNGKLYCMFVKVLIYLSDLRLEEDGPFCYLQGSHKANLPWFDESALAAEKPALTKENFPSLELVYAEAGDAVLLNEALLHGTLPKSTEGERLVMAFSYAPAFVADWKAIDIRSDDIEKLGHY
jgi:hypothetical protein